MKLLFSLLLLGLGWSAQAQINGATLQASGLTCSMCSKAVKNALEKVPFVEKVLVDIKNQQYKLTFRSGTPLDFDGLSKAVEDAGFSVAALSVTATLPVQTLAKDQHVQIGNQYFHFLNGSGQALNGATTFTLVDKSFVLPKEYKKWSSRSKMS
ncbi:MAG TPA: heavy-metal-associated domain-containing protein, partial [Chitinophagaceae bacterium]|nr:heavy-metal-associated domain-containing protein [Chitinophagaceae bacterium]